jgi:hypothetical protein
MTADGPNRVQEIRGERLVSRHFSSKFFALPNVHFPHGCTKPSFNRIFGCIPNATKGQGNMVRAESVNFS